MMQFNIKMEIVFKKNKNNLINNRILNKYKIQYQNNHKKILNINNRMKVDLNMEISWIKQVKLHKLNKQVLKCIIYYGRKDKMVLCNL